MKPKTRPNIWFYFFIRTTKPNFNLLFSRNHSLPIKLGLSGLWTSLGVKHNVFIYGFLFIYVILRTKIMEINRSFKFNQFYKFEIWVDKIFLKYDINFMFSCVIDPTLSMIFWRENCIFPHLIIGFISISLLMYKTEQCLY